MPGDDIRLYTYWRSSACYRVRIGLNLKGLAYESRPIHLIDNGGEQHSAAFRDINPQELIPVLLHGGRVLRQSLAILEYLDEVAPDRPLLPAVSRERQRVRAIAQSIACDIHPLGNLRVQQYLETQLGASQQQREDWTRHWSRLGLRALERTLDDPATGDFCEGDTPSLADCCLVPQVYNARRFGIAVESEFPIIARIDAACLALPAFDAARPELQPDAPATTAK